MNNLTDIFLTIKELQEILGYKDNRSVYKWCSENKVPIITFGKLKYVHKTAITIVMYREMQLAYNLEGMDGEQAVKASISGNKERLANILNSKFFGTNEITQDDLENNEEENIEDLLNTYKNKSA